MLTVDEALKAIDPSLDDATRLEQAARLQASSVALDAYLDSRSQLEQIIERAKGAGNVASFQELNDPEAIRAAEGAPIEGTAVEEPAGLGTGKVEDATVVSEDPEIAALQARIDALTAAKAGKGA